MIKFSLIIPIYNVENYISKTMDSIIAQSYQNIEIICVNDGSTDNSLNILEEFARKDSRIKIINQENQGVSVARNTGLTAASGEYIWFIDGDDFIELNACQQLYEKLNKTNADIVLFKAQIIDNNKKIPWIKFDNKILKLFEQKECINFQECFNIVLNQYNSISSCDKAYKLSFINRNNVLFNKQLNYAEDSLFVYQLLLCNPNLAVINEFLYNYKLRNDSVTHKTPYEMFCGHFNFEKEIKKSIYTYKENLCNEHIYLYLLNLYITYWNLLYFSKYKKFYVLHLKDYLLLGNKNNFNVKRLKKHLFFAKLHISWWYWKIIRPIGKYCIVLPYRYIKSCIIERIS